MGEPRRRADGGWAAVSLLQALRQRLNPPQPREGVVIEYYAFDPEGVVRQRECLLQAVPGVLIVNCAKGWTQRFEFTEVGR